MVVCLNKSSLFPYNNNSSIIGLTLSRWFWIMWIDYNRDQENDVIFYEIVRDMDHVIFGLHFFLRRLVTCVDVVFHVCHILCNILVRYDRKSLFSICKQVIYCLHNVFISSVSFIFALGTSLRLSAPISICHALQREVTNINMADWMGFLHYITGFKTILSMKTFSTFVWVKVVMRSGK